MFPSSTDGVCLGLCRAEARFGRKHQGTVVVSTLAGDNNTPWVGPISSETVNSPGGAVSHHACQRLANVLLIAKLVLLGNPTLKPYRVHHASLEPPQNEELLCPKSKAKEI